MAYNNTRRAVAEVENPHGRFADFRRYHEGDTAPWAVFALVTAEQHRLNLNDEIAGTASLLVALDLIEAGEPVTEEELYAIWAVEEETGIEGTHEAPKVVDDEAFSRVRETLISDLVTLSREYAYPRPEGYAVGLRWFDTEEEALAAVLVWERDGLLMHPYRLDVVQATLV